LGCAAALLAACFTGFDTLEWRDPEDTEDEWTAKELGLYGGSVKPVDATCQKPPVCPLFVFF
jgi:hypothetical protein